MPKAANHKWMFAARFRRHAFGWRSQPAIARIKEAVSEIAQVARHDSVLAAEGGVLFLEKISPALEHVDSSSGAIGSAVNRAIEVLAAIIATAPGSATAGGTSVGPKRLPRSGRTDFSRPVAWPGVRTRRFADFSRARRTA